MVLDSGKQQILYDPVLLPSPVPEMFDPGYWASQDCLEGSASGRGTTYFVRHSDHIWTLRHYMRGGLVARIMNDLYWGFRPECSRSFREWQLLLELFRKGLPVPRPVAASVEQVGLLYRADIIVEKIPKTDTLANRLKSAPQDDAVWEAVGVCVSKMHRLNCFHADLNAMNILLDEEQRVYLIDFDRACFRRGGGWKERNLKRLHRSLTKLKRLHSDFSFNMRSWQAFLAGYYRTDSDSSDS